MADRADEIAIGALAVVAVGMLVILIAATEYASRHERIQRWERRLCFDRGGVPMRRYQDTVLLAYDVCVWGGDSIRSLEHPKP